MFVVNIIIYLSSSASPSSLLFQNIPKPSVPLMTALPCMDQREERSLRMRQTTPTYPGAMVWTPGVLGFIKPRLSGSPWGKIDPLRYMLVIMMLDLIFLFIISTSLLFLLLTISPIIYTLKELGIFASGSKQNPGFSSCCSQESHDFYKLIACLIIKIFMIWHWNVKNRFSNGFLKHYSLLGKMSRGMVKPVTQRFFTFF